MSMTFDHEGINHATVAIRHEMTPQGRDRHQDADTIFLGGAAPSDADQIGLANFGLRKNYKLIFASFDPADPSAGPTGFHAVITDGTTEAVGLKDGRLWKRDQRSPAILLFPDVGAVLAISAKGNLFVRGMKGQYHAEGYEAAREAVVARAARNPGRTPVIAPIEDLVIVVDIGAVADGFAAAA